MDESDKVKTELDKFLDKGKLYNNLALSALFIATFEILNWSIIINIRDFLSNGELIDTMKKKPKRYIAEMKPYFQKYKGADSEYRGCCDWSENMKLITKEDNNNLILIKKQRNTIAHELPNLLLEPQRNINIDLLIKAKELIGKIDKWWILNVHIPTTNPYHDEKVIEESEILSGREIMLNHIFDSFVNNKNHL